MRSLRLILIMLIVLIVGVSPAAAQVVLTGGDIHLGNGKVIEGGDVVLLSDGTLGAVGANVAAPQNATVIDVSGKIVTPGFIDIATGVGLTEIGAVDHTRQGNAGGIDAEKDPIRAAFRAADAFNPGSVVLPITRAHGVTNVVTRPSGGLVSGQAALVELRGEGAYGTVIDPYIALETAVGSRGGEAVGSSRGTAMLRLRELYDDAKFWQTNRARFDENRSRSLSASRLDLAAVAETFDGDKRVFVRADKASDILATISLARELGIQPVILGGAEAWMVAQELAREKIPVVVNPMYNMPWSFDALGSRLDNAALLQQAGVSVVLSTFSTHNVRNLRFYAGNAVRAGLGFQEALAAVTSVPAEAIGKLDSLGTLEAGKTANVVVWSGDPFEPSSAVEHVFVRGAEVDLSNRQSKLLDRYRTLERRGAPAELRTEESDGGHRNQTGGKDVESDD